MARTAAAQPPQSQQARQTGRPSLAGPSLGERAFFVPRPPPPQRRNPHRSLRQPAPILPSRSALPSRPTTPGPASPGPASPRPLGTTVYVRIVLTPWSWKGQRASVRAHGHCLPAACSCGLVDSGLHVPGVVSQVRGPQITPHFPAESVGSVRSEPNLPFWRR